MSKRFKAALFLAIPLCLVLGSILFILLEPGSWSNEIISYLNDNVLKENGWTITVDSVDGQLTSDIYFQNLNLEKTDGSIKIHCDQVKINLDYTQILAGNWAISQLSCKRPKITLKLKEGERGQKFSFVEKLARNGFNIRELSVETTFLNILEGKSDRLYEITTTGKIYSSSGSLIFSPTTLQIIDFQNDLAKITVKNGEIELGETTINTQIVDGTANETPFSLNAHIILYPKIQLDIDLTAREIVPEPYIPDNLEDYITSEQVDIKLHLQTDMNLADIYAKVHDSRTSDLLGEASIHAEKEKENIHFHHSELKIGSNKLTGEGSLLGNGELALNLSMDRFDLNEIGLIETSTNINGLIQLNGKIEAGKISEFVSFIELQNEEIGNEHFVSVNGSVRYKDEVLTISDSLEVNLGYNTVLANGWFNVTKERLNIYLFTDEVDLYSMGNMLGLNSLAGKVKGAVIVEGYARDPLVWGDVTIEDGKYNKATASEIAISFHVNSVASNRDGWLNAQVINGNFLDHEFSEGVLNISFQGDAIIVQNARFDGEGDYLQVSGKIVGDQSLLVDQMQLSLRDQFFTNQGQIALHRIPGGLTLDPVTFRMGEGNAEVSFVYQDRQLKDGKCDFVNIDLATIWSILNKDVSLVGTALGEFSAKTIEEQLELQATIDVRDGLWSDIEFDHLLFTCNLENDQLYIKEFRFQAPNDVSLDISGFYGIQQGSEGGFLKLDPEGEIDFSSEFKKFELGLVSGYVVDWSLGGAATGSLSMKGLAKSPEIDFKFSVEDPWLDKIRGEVISGSARYTDRRLFFENLSGQTKTGFYSGEGYLPVDLAIIPEEKDRFIEYDPVYMEFESNTSSLDFLTPYFDDIDSVKGDMEIKLNIEGTPVAPIRNGSFNITDGQIYALMLDFPIDQINGSATLKNNKFIIDDLTTLSLVPPGADWAEKLKGILFKKSEEKIPYNMKVTGVMDMETFFSPDLAFHISGEEVYFRTLLGEIEGITDLDLSITGKDTINIDGDIIPTESVLRMEFGEESYEDIEPDEGTIIRYNLHFPIAGNVFIKNSQIDAEIEGDISLFRLGNESYQYSGELEVIEGRFYYYSDVFDIQRGHLIFDPSEFNPQIDIEATTKIEGIDIQVNLSGDFEEPFVTIEDSEQYYSQEELLQILTIHKLPDESGLTGEVLSSQSVDLFGKYLESEFERNLVRATPLLDEFEIEGPGSLLSGSLLSRPVKAGTRLSSNLYLSYKQNFSLSSEFQWGVEYRISRKVSLVVTYDEDGEMHLRYRWKNKF